MAKMARQGTFVVPTLTVYVYHRESASLTCGPRGPPSTRSSCQRAAGSLSWAWPSRPAPTRGATGTRNALDASTW